MTTILLLLLLADDSAVDRVFNKVRQGDLSSTKDLVKLGAAAVAPVEKYLGDANVQVRTEAVAVLAAIGGAGACTALAGALADDVADIRARASLAFYHGCGRPSVACDRLLTGIGKGDVSAAAILLAGYCREAKNALTQVGKGDTKLESYGPVVPLRLVAGVALLRLGDPMLVSSKARPQVETEFLLQVLTDIEDPGWLASALDDQRTALSMTGVPRGVKPVRRVCDVAADAFARRFALPFQMKAGKRYSVVELSGVREAVRVRLK